jgi:hypothetical protein
LGLAQFCPSKAEIIIGEGCGSGKTPDVFAALGYSEMAKNCGIKLVDFNEIETVILENKKAFQLKQFYMPKIVQDAFIISPGEAWHGADFGQGEALHRISRKGWPSPKTAFGGQGRIK